MRWILISIQFFFRCERFTKLFPNFPWILKNYLRFWESNFFTFYVIFHDFRDLSDWQGAYQIYNTVKVRAYFHLSFASLLQFCLFYVLNLLFNYLFCELSFIFNLMKSSRSPSLYFFFLSWEIFFFLLKFFYRLIFHLCLSIFYFVKYIYILYSN